MRSWGRALEGGGEEACWQITSISAGAVKRYLSDAHAKLADALARHEGDVYDPA